MPTGSSPRQLENGREAEAVRVLGEVLALKRAKLGPHDSGTIESVNHLVEALHRSGRLSDGIRLLEESLPGARARLGDGHAWTIETLSNLAETCGYAGRLLESVRYYEQTLRLKQEHLGPDDVNTLVCMYELGAADLEAGRPDRAEPLFREARAGQLKRRITEIPASPS